jgi:hypothetical protein
MGPTGMGHLARDSESQPPQSHLSESKPRSCWFKGDYLIGGSQEATRNQMVGTRHIGGFFVHGRDKNYLTCGSYLVGL